MSQIEFLRERAVEAIALVENPVYQEAIRGLRERYYGELIQAQPGTLTATAAHAKLLALEDVTGQLKVFINDVRMRQK